MMNTSKKEIKFLSISDDIPRFIGNDKTKLNYFIVSYNMSDFEKEYPTDRIIKFLSEECDYIDYSKYLKYANTEDYIITEFEDVSGFILMETEDSIYVYPVWSTEYCDIVYDLVQVITDLKPNQTSNLGNTKTEELTNMFNFIPL